MKILIFLKGFLMGICDIIPGVSGGTIAFITGIYQRLIEAVKNFSPKLAIDFFKYLRRRNKTTLSNLKEDIKKLDLVFLGILALGIGTAILIGAQIISFLLEKYFVFTISFFIGLILASSKVIFDNINNHKPKNIAFSSIGLIIGISLSFIVETQIKPNLGFIFLAGFLAISAMFLPGISGAFILLILGVYKFMLDVLHDIIGNFSYFTAFILGAMLGAFTISRVISYVFKKDKNKTLYVLLGLVIGSLSIPLKQLISNYSNFSDIIASLFFIIIGILVVVGITKIEHGRKKE